MIETMKVGPCLPAKLATAYSKRLTRALGVDTIVVHAGMEDLHSPYMLLRIDGRAYLLLERTNDDGEWAPLLFDAPADLDTRDATAVWHAAASVDKHAQELTRNELAGRGIVHRDDVDDPLLELYTFRDHLSYRYGTGS